MKLKIRFLSFLTALLLVCSLGIQAFAAEAVSPISPAVAPALIDAARLQKMMDDFVAEYSLDKQSRSISVGFCYLKTGDTWYYNADKWYYSASLYKVPVAMLLAEREVAGEISADTVFENQYSTATLDDLERRSIVNSDNQAGHALVEWMGGTYAGKSADKTIKYTSLPNSYFPQDFFDYSYYNVEYYTQVLQTLYKSPENFPRVLNYMKQAQPGAYLRTNLEGKYEVAQKYGAFEETKAYPTKNNNHAGGIIYTPNPIALTVMSVNMENFNKRIGDLAEMFADYALELDGKLDAYEAEQVRLQREEAERLVREEQERLAREEEERRNAAAAAATPVPVPTVAPTQAPSATIAAPGDLQSKGLFDIGSTQKMILITGLAVFMVGLALLIVIVNSKHRRKAKAASRMADDGLYDDDEEEYLEPPEVMQNPRRGVRRKEEDYRSFSEEAPMEEPSEEYYGEEYLEEEEYPAEEYSEEEYAEEREYPEEEPGADYADYGDAEPEDAPLSEEPEEYLTGGDYLENDSFLDQSDYKDFQTDYGYGNYSAYDTEVYEKGPQEKNRFTGTGNHYKPKH